MTIIRKIRKLFFRGLVRDRFQVVKRGGLNFLLNYTNSIDRKIIVDGGYEKDRIKYFRELIEINQCRVFIDVGANVGLYTVNVSQVESIQKVYAFEPSTRNRYQLQANLLLNSLYENVEVLPFALSDKEGEMVFLENAGNSTGRSRLKETNINKLDPDKFTEKVIKVRRLDDIIHVKNDKLAIKIDVEGHEENAMKGMVALMTSNDCVLQVEIFPANVEKVDRYLCELGFMFIKAIKMDRYYTNNISMNHKDKGLNSN